MWFFFFQFHNLVSKKKMKNSFVSIMILILFFFDFSFQLTTITNCTGLQIISNLTDNYELANDIDCLGATINPIGNTTNKFTGTFNGQGKSISNFTINKVGVNDVGLFGSGANCSVTNLILKDFLVSSNGSVVGALFGSISNSTLNNIQIQTSISSENSINAIGSAQNSIGGLVKKTYFFISLWIHSPIKKFVSFTTLNLS